MPAEADDTHESSPPPRYSESSNVVESKGGDLRPYNQGPWLVRRTSIHIESSAADTESSRCTSISSGSTGQKRPFRRLFQKTDHHDSLAQLSGAPGHQFGAPHLGTQVIIEATQPTKTRAERRIELKGLEQAASAKRWNGSGRPAEPWGKLMQDPELWDESGDTHVYFGYQRSTPSFLIRASLLEQMGSDHLNVKLQEGARKDSKDSRPSSQSTRALSSIGGFKSLAIGSKSSRAGSTPRVEPRIRRDIYFPAPHEASRLDILRYHLTTRNLFALLLDKPLVGLTFYQALVDLQGRLEDLVPTSNAAATIIKYLTGNGFHNVSNEPSAAAGLLGWSEDNFWPEGWREGYVHCTGMYSKLRTMPEFRDLSHISRSALERSNLELSIKIEQAEKRLATFYYDDMWLIDGPRQRSIPTPFNSFQRFLQRHYEKAYKSWPPRLIQGLDTWLSPSLVKRLKEDFGALYRYYVDQNIVWDDAKHIMISMPNRYPLPSRQGEEWCLEVTISDFDQKHRYTHIPCPYPLLPISVSIGNATNQSDNKTFFGSRTKANEKRNLALSKEASNANLLSTHVLNNPLVEAFIKFDKVDNLKEEDLQDVRKVRWVLLYGIIQSLSQLGCDTPHIWFKEGVNYFTNARLKGMIPWKADEMLFDSAQPDVHSWLA